MTRKRLYELLKYGRGDALLFLIGDRKKYPHAEGGKAALLSL